MKSNIGIPACRKNARTLHTNKITSFATTKKVFTPSRTSVLNFVAQHNLPFAVADEFNKLSNYYFFFKS